MEEKALIHSYMDPDTVKVGFHCILGPDKGKFFPFQGDRMVVRRGRTVELRVNDINSSREHFEVVRLKTEFILSDLQSQNGTLVNEEKVIQKKILHNDKISFGSTVLSFYISDDFSEMVKNPLEYEKKKNSLQNLSQQKVSLTAIAVVLVGIFVFLLVTDDEQVVEAPLLNNRNDVASDLREVNAGLRLNSRKTEKLVDIEQEKNVKVILNRGLREMREQNYFRAISEFNHALELSPGHPKASFYLNKANDELNSVIEHYNLSATRDLQSLQYRKALISYCSILRLLHNFPESQQYKDTQKKIAEINKVLEIEDSENSCH
ncbi:MAG: FHA domain-containing protein [Bacteriovoracaceae bacterium]|nr:FHA domain-containing protein [Bacteriovoracaceae bacterium]